MNHPRATIHFRTKGLLPPSHVQPLFPHLPLSKPDKGKGERIKESEGIVTAHGQSRRSVRWPTDTYLQTQACVDYHHKFGSTGLWQQASGSSFVWGCDMSENETLKPLVQPKSLPFYRFTPEKESLHPALKRAKRKQHLLSSPPHTSLGCHVPHRYSGLR